jgi:hypothetical protein
MSKLPRQFYLVAALIAVIAAPAFAQAATRYKAQRPAQATPRDLYYGQRHYHSDPDPNVQFDLMREQNWRKGG